MKTTKVQYVIIDSNNVSSTMSKNNFSVNMLSNLVGSSTTATDLNNVIGFKIVDAFFGGIGTSGPDAGSPDYIDITCEDLPPIAQLAIVNGKSIPVVLARIPLERSLSGSNDLVIYDKQWKPWPRHNVYFNPLNLEKLSFKIYERLSDGTYQLMDFTGVAPRRSYYFTIELTSIVEG